MFLDVSHQEEFGVRWLLRHLEIYPNAYYNYRKHRKAHYYAQKTEVQEQIRSIYHGTVKSYAQIRLQTLAE